MSYPVESKATFVPPLEELAQGEIDTDVYVESTFFFWLQGRVTKSYLIE